jgi:hypothetical protein
MPNNKPQLGIFYPILNLVNFWFASKIAFSQSPELVILSVVLKFAANLSLRTPVYGTLANFCIT